MGWVVSVTPRPRLTPGGSTLGTHWTGGWVGPRAGLDTEGRGKIICPCRGSNPDLLVVQPVVRHYTAWAIPAPCNLHSVVQMTMNQLIVRNPVYPEFTLLGWKKCRIFRRTIKAKFWTFLFCFLLWQDTEHRKTLHRFLPIALHYHPILPWLKDPLSYIIIIICLTALHGPWPSSEASDS
jgi:hypothetical protein